MGKILCRRIELITVLSETIGYKSGLTLSKNEISERLPEYSDFWEGDDSDGLGIRSEVVADMVAKLLHQVGSIPSLRSSTIGVEFYKKYSDNPEHLALLYEIIDWFGKFVSENQQNHKESKLLNGDAFMELVLEKYGPGLPIKIALEYIQAIQLAAYTAPWSEVRYVDWKDTVELSQLFKNESLSTYYGKFFDQRFIDYLYKNFDHIDKMNWRKFEGLTAEFFTREGFHVNIGAGRNDESIDARVYPAENDTDKPPLILIQCKRQKEKVEKVIVKALWADIQAEKAQSGLIVTTNCLSPGAAKVSQARAYPIEVADRETLREWLIKMRSPFTGVFLGE